MSRGLVLGATLISFFCFILCIISAFAPTWLILRTESEEKFCWWGEGIFQSRLFWGDDLPLVKTKCQDPEHIGLITTERAYCSDDPVDVVNGFDPPGYSQLMCKHTRAAKATSIVAVLASLSASIIGTVMHCKRFRRRIEYTLVMGALTSAVLTIVFAGLTTGIMMTSPLFSKAHTRALSEKHSVGVPFNGLGCSYQTPLHSPFSLMLPSALKCLFPGPSMAAEILLFLVMPIGVAFFWMLSREVLISSKSFPASVQASLLSSSPMFNTSDYHDHDVEYHNLASPDDGFDELRKQRVYSIYGALARRYSHWNPKLRFFMITLLPFLIIAGNALTWSGFLLLGLQILGGAYVTLYMPKKSSKNEFMTISMDATLLQDNPDLLFVNAKNVADYPVLRDVFAWLTGILSSSDARMEIDDFVKLTASSSSHFLHQANLTSSPYKHLHGKLLFQDIANVFNFSPVLSTTFFWTGGARLIAVLTILAMFGVPIGKALVWVWYYFAPADEVWRGRILTLVDFSGKYMLAYLFVLAILAIAMGISRTIAFPGWLLPGILPHNAYLVVEARVGLTSGDGMGSWLFVLACVFSLIIGQLFVVLHQYTVEWEEERRSKPERNFGSSPPIINSATMSSQSTWSGSGYQGRALTRDSPWAAMDTPSAAYANRGRDYDQLLEGAGGAVVMGGGGNDVSTSRPKTTADFMNHTKGNNLMQAIQSFGNLQELADARSGGGMLSGSSAAAFEARRPVLNAIARFGSRTMLAEEVFQHDDSSRISPVVAGGQPSILKRPHRVKLAKAIHPTVEAMCDRVHQPMQGVRLRWTPFGKAVILFFQFLLSAMILISQMVSLFRIEMTGFSGDFVEEPKDKITDYSIVSCCTKVLETGWSAKPYEIMSLMFLTLSIMPLIRLLGTVYLWLLPLTVKQQKQVFDFLEIVSAWSSLEVFLIALVGIRLEIESITTNLTGNETPNMAILVHMFLPFEKGLISSKIKLLSGFWFVMGSIILEKILSYLITQQAAIAITERQAERFLRSLARQSAMDGTNRDDLGGADHFIEDATEGLLQTRAAYFFSPAGRYTVAPQTLYAGLPRYVWSGWFVRFGFMADADVVATFGSPSSRGTSPVVSDSFGPTIGFVSPGVGGVGALLNDGFDLDHHPSPSYGGGVISQVAMRRFSTIPDADDVTEEAGASSYNKTPFVAQLGEEQDDWPVMF